MSTRRLRAERGFALIMALGLLTIMTIVGTTATYYATTNLTGATTHKARTSAYDLAEAGVNAALAKLAAQLDPDPNSWAYGTVLPGAVSPTNTALFPSTPATAIVVQYPDLHGSVSYYGTLDKAKDPYVWTITSTGKVKNGQAYQERTLRRRVNVNGTGNGNGNSWSRFYQDSTASCLTIDTDTVVTNFATRGPLCLVNGAAITGANTTLDVGGTVTISGPDTSAGPRSPTAGSGWTNPTYVTASDTNYATYSVSANSNSAAQNATGFGFSIPTTAIVRGISVTVVRKANTSNLLWDNNVYMLKASAQVGSSKSGCCYWGTTDYTTTYGSSSDLWGTTWTAADINNSGFGARFIAHNDNCCGSNTANLNYISITVTYSNDTNGIGTSGTPIKSANIGGTCTYNAQAAHTPCTATDHVNATTIATLPLASNPALKMPAVDFTYWWKNAKPGPKTPCDTATKTGTPPTFDNDAGATSAPNRSVGGFAEMTPTNASYTCKVTVNGALVGEMSWNYTTHVMTIYGTIFIDGDFRFDDDGQVIHYQGRATIYSGGNDEIDEVVCAGGSGTTWATSCLTNMASWDPSTNLMVLMSEVNNEYDQGNSSTCSGSPPNCYDGIVPAGFQGVLYSTGDCLIHQRFQDSGPVICNTITMPNEGGINPTYFTFPYLGNLTDGQSYGAVATSSNFKLTPVTQTGG